MSDPGLRCFEADGADELSSYLTLNAAGDSYFSKFLGPNGTARILLLDGEWQPYYGRNVAGSGLTAAAGPVGTYTIDLANPCNTFATLPATFTTEPINFNQCPSDGTAQTAAAIAGSIKNQTVPPNGELTFCLDINDDMSAFELTGNSTGIATIEVRDEDGAPLVPPLTLTGDGTLDLSALDDRVGLQLVVTSNDVDGGELTLIGSSLNDGGMLQRISSDFSAGNSVIGANGCETIGSLDNLLMADALSNLTGILAAGDTTSICADISESNFLIVAISDNDDAQLTLDFIGSDGQTIGSVNSASGTVSIPPELKNGVQIVATATDPGPPEESVRTITVSNVFTGTSASTTITLPADPATPVTLTAFNGHYRGKVVELDWATQDEINNEGFEVQRSPDGHSWGVLDFVQAHGSTFGDYRFTDATPLAGANYYRLKQMDYDGASTYSPMVTVATGAGAELSLFPNPTGSTLHVRLGERENNSTYTARIINQLGATVSEQPLNDGGTLDVSGLPAGTYVLSVSGGAFSTSRRFQKK